LTDAARGQTTVSYTPQPAPNEPYNTTENYEFSLIVDPTATLMLCPGCREISEQYFERTIESVDNE
jgi:hypothetical protein